LEGKTILTNTKKVPAAFTVVHEGYSTFRGCCSHNSDRNRFCPVEKVVVVVVRRFADVFGARAALSLACSSTVVFFLLLAIAENPAMLFIHKLPTVFMHVLTGKCHSSRIPSNQFNILNLKPRLLFHLD